MRHINVMHSDNLLTETSDPGERPAAGVGDLEGRISQKFVKGAGKASQTEKGGLFRCRGERRPRSRAVVTGPAV